jgi:hypothetical protein
MGGVPSAFTLASVRGTAACYTFNAKMNFVDDAGNASVFDGTVKVQHAADPLYADP